MFVDEMICLYLLTISRQGFYNDQSLVWSGPKYHFDMNKTSCFYRCGECRQADRDCVGPSKLMTLSLHAKFVVVQLTTSTLLIPDARTCVWRILPFTHIATVFYTWIRETWIHALIHYPFPKVSNYVFAFCTIWDWAICMLAIENMVFYE